MEEKLFLSNINKDKNILVNDEAERLYQIYLQVQSGDKTALNGLFKQTDNKQICRADEMNKEYRMSHMDNILDMESVLDNEKNRQEDEWTESVNSSVIFSFECLNKIVSKSKRDFLNKAKYTEGAIDASEMVKRKKIAEVENFMMENMIYLILMSLYTR